MIETTTAKVERIHKRLIDARAHRWSVQSICDRLPSWEDVDTLLAAVREREDQVSAVAARVQQLVVELAREREIRVGLEGRLGRHGQGGGMFR